MFLANPKKLNVLGSMGQLMKALDILEVQFWWTGRHIEEKKVVTMVTSHSSGSSYLNRVELQNGCLAVAHANLFIPSTLNGIPIDPSTGSVDESILTANLNQAADIYIERVNHCPCGVTEIHLIKGATSVEYQEKRKKLQIFLKGSNLRKEELCRNEPDLFDYFSRVWSVRCNHVRQGVPMQYVFLLICCYKPDCYHPLCQQQTCPQQIKWFCGGPDVEKMHLLLPVADPTRPFGGTNCKSCKGCCSGHFLPAEQRLASLHEPMMPPS